MSKLLRHTFSLFVMVKMNTKILTGMEMVLVAILVMSTLAVASAASTNAENVIIAPPEFYQQAKDLEAFHDSKGIETEVIETTWIYENYEEAEDPPYDGYKDSSITGWENIKGYDYSLAKRMISFFDDTSAHPNLECITLLGNARLVPPSYYIYLGHYKTYDNWIPTDFFYSSPDYDYVPNYKIGRLPVDSSEEAEHVVNKIKNWDANLNWDWFKNVTMVGGSPYGMSNSEYRYTGELDSVYIINHFLDGMNVAKLFETDDKFDKLHMMEPLAGNTGMIFEDGHGKGNCWSFNGGDVCVSDLLELSPNTKVPIIVSTACRNGAFDTNVYDGGFSTSIGEGVLLSDAAGIAYIGSARRAKGSCAGIIEKGYLEDIRCDYMCEMLINTFRAYHEGATTLGDITKSAMETYYTDNDFSDKYNKVTFFEFVLLGDPALELPERQSGVSYQQPNLSAAGEEGYNNYDRPFYEYDENITVHATTDSPTVSTKLIHLPEDEVIETTEGITTGNAFDYTFTTSKETKYLVRISSADGKEGWFYLHTAKPITGQQILLVNDDEGYDNMHKEVESYFENALNETGYTYDTWSVEDRGTVSSSSFLKEYDCIVWVTGDSGDGKYETLSLDDQENLKSYLDSGGKLFISGEDIGYDLTSVSTT